ncbi:MAG: acetyl-CoA carboxylase subunit beta [Lentisphaerae bacterium RIFOXYA12_FULL_48_11]|nr:MAG: acetyl-CoA carboxylase subunit beta [Lentisphaerae bacterium RIFOXYA12_FULL_48_11]
MGWFRKKEKPQEVVTEKKDLWTICPSCKAHVYKDEWDKNFSVCPQCNFHDKINWKERMDILLDPGTFREINDNVSTADPLEFKDSKGSYAEKAEATKVKTGMKEAVITGRGKIHGIRVVMAVMDFRFLGGSLASGTGEKILLASEYALRHKYPYIVVSASGGARMHEGIISLMQMAKTCAGVARLKKMGIPYISILTDPTTGGVSASFATMGDINIAEPKALIGFAGRRVIEETIKQKLPDDFQTAEYVLDHGFIDQIVNRKEMKNFLYKVLRYWKAK